MSQNVQNVNSGGDGYDAFAHSLDPDAPNCDHAEVVVSRPACLDGQKDLNRADMLACLAYYRSLCRSDRSLRAKKRRLIFTMCQKLNYWSLGYQNQEGFLKEWVVPNMGIQADYARRWIYTSKLEAALEPVVTHLSKTDYGMGDFDLLALDLTENQLRALNRVEGKLTDKANVFLLAYKDAPGNDPKAIDFKKAAAKLVLLLRDEPEPLAPDTDPTFSYHLSLDRVDISCAKNGKEVCRATSEADAFLSTLPIERIIAHLKARSLVGDDLSVINTSYSYITEETSIEDEESHDAKNVTIVTKSSAPYPGQTWEYDGKTFRIENLFDGKFGGCEFDKNGKYIRDTLKSFDFFESATLIPAA